MKLIDPSYKNKVDKRLLFRQRIFIVIISALIILNAINIWKGKVTLTLALSGFLLCLILGLGLSRMFKIHWHEESQKVISRLDKLGFALLIIYLVIELSRKWFFEHWLSGGSLNAFSLIVLSGLLLGRFLGTDRKIKKIIQEKNLEDQQIQ